MPIFASADKTKKESNSPKKVDKPKKLPDSQMDKVAGGAKPDSGNPLPTSDGKTG